MPGLAGHSAQTLGWDAMITCESHLDVALGQADPRATLVKSDHCGESVADLVTGRDDRCQGERDPTGRSHVEVDGGLTLIIEGVPVGTLHRVDLVLGATHSDDTPDHSDCRCNFLGDRFGSHFLDPFGTDLGLVSCSVSSMGEGMPRGNTSHGKGFAKSGMPGMGRDVWVWHIWVGMCGMPLLVGCGWVCPYWWGVCAYVVLWVGMPGMPLMSVFASAKLPNDHGGPSDGRVSAG